MHYNENEFVVKDAETCERVNKNKNVDYHDMKISAEIS